MKYNIIPKMFVVENREAEDSGIALVHFAMDMDLDMNNYFKAVPEGECDSVIADDICKMIRSMKLSASDCSNIFRAVKAQSSVLGGKLWTTEDIANKISDEFSVEASDDALDAVSDIAERDHDEVFDDSTDNEWNAIRDSIMEAELSVGVSNIEWEVDKEEFDEEAEYNAVIENLPKAITIPLKELDNVLIEDYLSDKYNYLVKGFVVEEAAA